MTDKELQIIKAIAGRLNQNKYKVNKFYIDRLLKNTKKRLEDIGFELEKMLSIEENLTKEKIEEKLAFKITAKKIGELKDKSEDGLEIAKFELILDFLKTTQKIKNIEAVIEHIKTEEIETYVTPKFSINSAGFISCAEPSLNGLTTEELKSFFNFTRSNQHIVILNEATELIDIIFNHKALFTAGIMPFVKGKLLFLEIKSVAKERINYIYKQKGEEEFLKWVDININEIEQTEDIIRKYKLDVEEEIESETHGDFLPLGMMVTGLKEQEKEKYYMQSHELINKLYNKYKTDNLKRLLNLFN